MKIARIIAHRVELPLVADSCRRSHGRSVSFFDSTPGSGDFDQAIEPLPLLRNGLTPGRDEMVRSIVFTERFTRSFFSSKLVGRFGIWLLAIAMISSVAIDSVQAQVTDPAGWSDAVEAQLRGIYERGQWQARRFDAEWLPDSTGYVMRVPQNNADQLQLQIYDVASGDKRDDPLPKHRERLRSPDGRRVLEFRGSKLFVKDGESESPIQLTENPGNRQVFYHRPAWCPDGKFVLFVESDETHLRKRSMLVPGDPSYPQVRQQSFARVGESIPSLRVGIVDIAAETLRWVPLKAPAEGYYLGQVEWAGNSDEILVETLSRFRDRRELLLFNRKTDSLRPVFQEASETWVDASQQKNLGLIWIRQGEQFIVISEKDGWRHAYLYSRTGRELANLTPGEFDIIDRGAVDENQGYFYFFASPENATQKYLYRVGLEGKQLPERVTPDNQSGTHDYLFSPDCKWAFHTYSSFDQPPLIELVELPTHRSVRTLEENSVLRDRFEQSELPRVEFLQLDIGNAVTLDAWMLKPRDFDPSKTYPVLVYVYGEPHAQTVLDSWGTVHDPFHRVIASLGYLVVSIDNRGTPAPKSAAWRRSVFGSLGPLSTEEQAAALQELARTRSYVDLSRVAIWGWSGGGSNTLNALFRKPELYHVGIAVVPKPQPHLYNAWFQEIYMRTPEVNPEGYQRSAPLNFAEGLRGKLLIITGSGETNTHLQIIEGLIDRLIELGKPFDYMVYPNRDHGLHEGRGTTVHVRMLIVRYLVENLPRGPR
jgi:dipeptidyl-peptidase 4